MYELRGGSFAKSFLLFLSLNNKTLLFKLHVFLFVLMCFGLTIEELHQRYMVNYCVRIIDENEFLLAIIQYFISALSWHMHEKEFRLLSFPWSWIFGILRLINFD